MSIQPEKTVSKKIRYKLRSNSFKMTDIRIFASLTRTGLGRVIQKVKMDNKLLLQKLQVRSERPLLRCLGSRGFYFKTILSRVPPYSGGSLLQRKFRSLFLM